MSDPKELQEAVPPTAKPPKPTAGKLKPPRLIAQLATGGGILFCLCDDGSFWQLTGDLRWRQLPTPPQPEN